MKQNVTRTLVLAAVALQSAFAQHASKPTGSEDIPKVSGAPVAYIYVSSSNNSKSTIHAFTASSSGNLTAISGSPFNANVADMAVNGKYLFGFGKDHSNIFSYLIESNGALKLTATTDTGKYNAGSCPILSYPLLDHTGATLYSETDTDGMCDNYAYQSFKIDKENGSLTYLGTTSSQLVFYSPLSFIKNNVYAYGASCTNYETGQIGTISGYRRASNGALELTSVGYTPGAPSGDAYCPSLTAADTSNHVAISVQLFDFNDPYNPLAPPKLATYTADSSGNLSTSSTTENMPKVSVGVVNDLKMAPSGKLLAVAGSSGIQIFHFNGEDPIKLDTQLRTTDNISKLFWDNDDHLYALSNSSGLLFVYTITPTSASQAAGSPYSLPGSESIIVQPK